MKVDLTLRSKTPTSYRAARAIGLYDVPPASEQTFHVTAELPLDDRDWKIGAIVGSSGSGKSTIAKTLWPESTFSTGQHEWIADCVLDDFPPSMTPDAVIALLTSVGLSSVPSWIKPYRVLSTGQQFRADLARTLAVGDAQPRSESASATAPVVFDEYTSTVDRVVARAVSVAVGKHVRRSSQRFVAVSCHRDFLPWLEADWVYDTDSATFSWGSDHRPSIRFEVREGSRTAWTLFRQHHYLTGSLANSSRVFLGYVALDDEPERLACFLGIMPSPGHKGWWRAHRLVVLPDLQGLGLGNRFQEIIAEKLWTAERKRYRITTSAPGLIHYSRKRPDIWRMAMAPKMKPAAGASSGLKKPGKAVVTSAGRLTCTLVYLPTALRK